MKLLKDRILKDGVVKPGNILKVDSFLNHQMDIPLINEIGQELAEIYHVQHLPSDFKKKNGYKRSIELSHEYDLYRQNYCGCVYSRREAENRK